MKKLLSLFLLSMLILTLTACGGDMNGDKETPEVLNEDTNVSNIESQDDISSSASKENTEKDEELNPDFKTAIDKYENFMNEYVAFMKRYKANPSDLSLLADYSEYMSKYVDFVASFDEWGNKDLNSAELAYYIEVQARVSKKLLEVAQ